MSKTLTEEEKEDIRKRVKAGQTAATIAADLHITLAAAKARIRRYCKVTERQKRKKTDAGAGMYVEPPKSKPEFKEGDKVKVLFIGAAQGELEGCIGKIIQVYKYFYLIQCRNYKTTVLKAAVDNTTGGHIVKGA